MSQLALNWVNPDPIRIIAQEKNAQIQPLIIESYALKFGFHAAGGPQVAEAQTVLEMHVDRSADHGSGELIVCADIHDGQNFKPPRHDGHRVFRAGAFFRPL